MLFNWRAVIFSKFLICGLYIAFLIYLLQMEEMRLKEAEAQEKRMRKDAERQEAMRRKVIV